MPKELLDILAYKTGCLYVSDLKIKANSELIKFELEKLSVQDFSLEQWNDAIEYLTEETTYFESREEAKKFLLNAKIITRLPL